jgi:hypothetical protein
MLAQAVLASPEFNAQRARMAASDDPSAGLREAL